MYEIQARECIYTADGNGASTSDPGGHLAGLELAGLLPLDTTGVSCDAASWSRGGGVS